MAFWDAWFKPKCAKCGATMSTPVEHDGHKICGDCHQEILDERAQAEAERAARLKAEEEARARVEGRQAWGSDPRLRT